MYTSKLRRSTYLLQDHVLQLVPVQFLALEAELETKRNLGVGDVRYLPPEHKHATPEWLKTRAEGRPLRCYKESSRWLSVYQLVEHRGSPFSLHLRDWK